MEAVSSPAVIATAAPAAIEDGVAYSSREPRCGRPASAAGLFTGTSLPARVCRPYGAGLLFRDAQQLPAGLLAAAAGLFADPAVLVVGGVARAFVAAAVAGGYAGL